MIDSPLITEAFDDPTMPCAVDIVSLIHKARAREPFDANDYHWIHILLWELYETQEFRLRLRLAKVEMELSDLHKRSAS